MHEVFFRQLTFARDDIALDQFGHFRSDHMGTQKLAGFGSKNRLDQAFRLPKSNRLAIADKGEFSDLQLLPGLLRIRFG